MALEVSECAVVDDDLEAIVGSFQRPPRPMAAILALSDVGTHERCSFLAAQGTCPPEQLVLGERRVRKTGRGKDLVLALRIEVEQANLGRLCRPDGYVGAVAHRVGP